MLAVAILAGALVAAEAPPAVDAKPAASVDYTADTPPPTAYDRAVGSADTEPPQEGVSLGAQLVRTMVSLVIVCGLIYLFAKFGLPRLMSLRPIGKPGKVLTVVERVALDPKNALVVVDVRDGPRLLFSSGDAGVALVADVGSLA